MRLAVLASQLGLVAGCGRIGFGASDGGPGGDDAPGGGDGALTGDGPGPMVDALIATGCAATTIIDDPFTTPGITGWTLVNTGAYQEQESGGVQQFSVVTSNPANTRVGLQLAQTRAFDGTCAIAEISMAAAGANIRTYLRLGTPQKNIEIYVENGQLWGRFTTNGGATTGTTGPSAYNPTMMRFLRLRASGSQNYALEYGPNLTTWMQFGSQGGGLVDPSPSYLEAGVAVVGVVGASTRADFERVIFLGP